MGDGGLQPPPPPPPTHTLLCRGGGGLSPLIFPNTHIIVIIKIILCYNIDGITGHYYLTVQWSNRYSVARSDPPDTSIDYIASYVLYT
jgi:hypothetical protein